MDNLATKYQLKNRDIQDLTSLVYLFSLILGCAVGFKIFDNIYFKIWLFVLLVYCFDNNKIIGIILGIMLFLVYQYISRKKLDNFKVLGVESINSDYATQPLLNMNEINEDVKNLELETPEQKHLNMIRSGEMLLNDARELQNDVNLLYDFREQNIADATKYNALVDINTGNNFFEGDILKQNSVKSLKSLQEEYNALVKANNYDDIKN